MTLQLLYLIVINYIFGTTPNRLNSTLFDNLSINRIMQQRPRRLRAVDILFYNIQLIIINSNLPIVHNYNQLIINSALRHAAAIIWRTRLTPQERHRYALLLNQNINQNIINQNTNNNIRYQPYRNPITTITTVNNDQNSGLQSAVDLPAIDINSGLNWDDNDNDNNDILHESDNENNDNDIINAAIIWRTRLTPQERHRYALLLNQNINQNIINQNTNNNIRYQPYRNPITTITTVNNDQNSGLQSAVDLPAIDINSGLNWDDNDNDNNDILHESDNENNDNDIINGINFYG
ncbi:hypothetical protein Glove_130g128 [Diversispora epigaea]|uniref:Uncharacterized protein n=1 Tax=Diversispora epigaea TaxID=1348612 RepID=A0A397J4H9_9GLOM|nr:hypothetical protein Glove_130g128 [Diversispora epigaea]